MVFNESHEIITNDMKNKTEEKRQSKMMIEKKDYDAALSLVSMTNIIIQDPLLN